MKANREIARKHFKKELKWLKDNIDKLTKNKHKFLIEKMTKINEKNEEKEVGNRNCQKSGSWDVLL